MMRLPDALAVPIPTTKTTAWLARQPAASEASVAGPCRFAQPICGHTLCLAPLPLQGTVLLDPVLQPRACTEFEAVLVLLGGHWPARGLLSGAGVAWAERRRAPMHAFPWRASNRCAALVANCLPAYQERSPVARGGASC